MDLWQTWVQEYCTPAMASASSGTLTYLSRSSYRSSSYARVPVFGLVITCFCVFSKFEREIEQEQNKTGNVTTAAWKAVDLSPSA